MGLSRASLAIVAACHLVAAAAAAQSSLYQQGEQALRAGQLDVAQQAFQAVLQANPKDVGAHANLGVVLMRKRQWDAALTELKKAQALAPGVIGLRLNIGLVQFRRGDYAAAAPEFQAVSAAQPDSVQSRYLLGLCYFLTDRYSDAHQALAPLREAEQANVQYLYAFGIASDNAGFGDDGKWAMGRLLNQSENSAEIHLLLGKAHLAHEEDDQALTEFAKAEALNGKLPFLHYYRGTIAKKRKDLDGARQEFMADMALEPDVPYNYEELANIDVLEGDKGDAEKYFRKAIQLQPRLTTARYSLAKLYRQEGRWREALAEADVAAATETHSASLHYLRAQILQALNRKAEAEKEFAASKQLRDSDRDELEEKLRGKRIREAAMGIQVP